MVDREIITHDTVPAFKEMCSLLRNQKLVKAWKIERNETMKIELENKIQKSRKLSSGSVDVSISGRQNSKLKQDKSNKSGALSVSSGSVNKSDIVIKKYKVFIPTSNLNRKSSIRKCHCKNYCNVRIFRKGGLLPGVRDFRSVN